MRCVVHGLGWAGNELVTGMAGLDIGFSRHGLSWACAGLVKGLAWAVFVMFWPGHGLGIGVRGYRVK
jgi:hypothetical protein